MGLFESQVEEVVKGGLLRVLEANRIDHLNQVAMNWDFFQGNQVSYIKKYPGEKDEEFNAKRKAGFNYTRMVILEYLAGVYQQTVRRTFTTQTNNSIIERIKESFPLDPFFRKVQTIAEISALCGVILRTDAEKKKIFFEAIPGEYISIYKDSQYADGVGHVIFAYAFASEDPDETLCMRVEGWSREKVIIYEKAGDKVKKIYCEDNNLRDQDGQPYIPIVFFKPDEDPNSDYGLSNINTVVDLNHLYNCMWMDIMRTVQLQQFSLLFLKRPVDQMAGDEYPDALEYAPTRLIEETNKDADAKYITPDPKIVECLKALEVLKKEMLDLSQVPIEVLSGSSKNGVESAAALRIKRIPIEKVWSRRKASYRVSDSELFKKTILFAKQIWNQGDTADLAPVIDYSEVEEPMDITEQQGVEEYEMSIGLTNPAQLYLDRNPDVGGEDAAKAAIQRNLDLTAELLKTGVKSPEEQVEDFLKRVRQFSQVKNNVTDDLKGRK